jgi:hypothetical protein
MAQSVLGIIEIATRCLGRSRGKVHGEAGGSNSMACIRGRIDGPQHWGGSGCSTTDIFWSPVIRAAVKVSRFYCFANAGFYGEGAKLFIVNEPAVFRAVKGANANVPLIGNSLRASGLFTKDTA